MTTVEFTQNDKRIKISAHDHTDKIVCSAVSMMMYALESWLINHPEFTRDHSSSLESGNAYIAFTPTNDEMYNILGFVYGGLLNLEYTYGKEIVTVKCDDSLISLMG